MSESFGGAAASSRHAFTTSAELSAGGRRLILVPLGAVEQHGPHLPVGTDSLIATAVAVQVAASRPDVLVAESLSFGSSGHHMNFSGTISLRPSTLMSVIFDVAKSIFTHGDVPVFLNGHGGNKGPQAAAMQELLEAGIQAWALTYFDLLSDVVARLFDNAESAVGHACALETSMVQHLWPDALRGSHVPSAGAQGAWPDPFLYPAQAVQTTRRFEEIDVTGVVGAPRLATSEAGAVLFAAAVDRVGAIIDRIAQSGTRSASSGHH